MRDFSLKKKKKNSQQGNSSEKLSYLTKLELEFIFPAKLEFIFCFPSHFPVFTELVQILRSLTFS